ncbi:hypothetical protein, partial [Kitasatospora sp. MAP5-34]|uniref:hypothetical protein n=1 Tax=Kitasatospora sp. MAP5-34 TaxID=3035102 RepID=UPI002474DB01
TLLSSQGTDASFKPLSQALRALRSFFRVSSLSDDFRSVFRSFVRPIRFPSAFRRSRLYQVSLTVFPASQPPPEPT